ncbi:hypothetical protein FRX31_018303, partial [Thalictrum thalictroides]
RRKNQAQKGVLNPNILQLLPQMEAQRENHLPQNPNQFEICHSSQPIQLVDISNRGINQGSKSTNEGVFPSGTEMIDTRLHLGLNQFGEATFQSSQLDFSNSANRPE